MNYFTNLAQKVTKGDLGGLPDSSLISGSDGAIAKGLKLAIGIAGAVSLLIITISAFQYTVSQGEPQSIAKARNSIIYAVLGLVVCIMAFAIITFVTSRI